MGFKFFIDTCLNLTYVVFPLPPVTGSDEQERFMAFLVDPLPFGKKIWIVHNMQWHSSSLLVLYGVTVKMWLFWEIQ